MPTKEQLYDKIKEKAPTLNKFEIQGIMLIFEQREEEIKKTWLSLDLRYSNMDNWDKELERFGLYMQNLSLPPKQKE